MASANSNIQITDLDFDSIKTNLKTFMRSQTKFKDYDFEGSGLSVLMDLLAYNTHYNAYYLNMVANEMFMDTAALRSSVVSHAKLLNYTPKSAIAPSATINLVSTGLTSSSLTIPKFTKFQSESIDGVNYTFITKDMYTTSVSSGTATFNDLEIIQGEPISLNFTYDSTSNPSQMFDLPDTNIDTTTLVIQVQKSSTNTEISTYNVENGISSISGSSEVYFLQEGLNGYYQIYFGDGLLGKKLDNGNVILVSYVVTGGTSATNANNFVLLDSIGGSVTVYPVSPATTGGEKESIESIKFQAPKSYSAQGRAVSYEDYITAIQQNKLGFSIDSVSVWGGEENSPPAFGQVFISVKPNDGYRLSDTQKKRLLEDVVKPISVVTVQPTIIDPDYTYLKITADVIYDQKQTTLTSNQLQENIKSAIQSFADSNLNTFNAVFSETDLNIAIKNSSGSIIANRCTIQFQKKIYPTLGVPKQYTLYYGIPLTRSVYEAGINSSPTIQYYTTGEDINLISDLYLEEVPFATSGVESISLLNPGFNYVRTPIIVISGDGTGATAHAIVKNGYVSEIVIDTPGNNYSQAIVSIVNDATDTSGTSATGYARLQGRYGNIRSYYYNTNGIKTILDDSIGTVDYQEGIITLNDFAPYDVNDPLGQFTLTANPSTTLISSGKNRIITVDPFDPTSITVNVTAK